MGLEWLSLDILGCFVIWAQLGILPKPIFFWASYLISQVVVYLKCVGIFILDMLGRPTNMFQISWKNHQLDLDNFTHFHNFNLWNKSTTGLGFQLQYFAKPPVSVAFWGRFFIGPSSVEEPWCWKWRAPPRMQSSPPGFWNNFVGLEDPWYIFTSSTIASWRFAFYVVASVLFWDFFTPKPRENHPTGRGYVSNGWFHRQV